MNAKGNANRSVRHTKKRIKDGFLQLLQAKPIQAISVKELVDFIDMNRGTFYFHYKDIYDLLEEIENEMLDNLAEILNQPQKTAQNRIVTIFDFLQENADFCSILLGSNGDTAFIERIKKMVEKTLKRIWEKLDIQTELINYSLFHAFIINGFIGIVEIWLNSNMEKTPTEMAEFTTDIIRANFQIFMNK